MKINKIYMIAALLGVALTGCQKVQEENSPATQPGDGNTWKLTVVASKDVNTKALSLDSNTLNATWSVGEKVNVFFQGTHIGTLEVQDTPTPGATAKLSGEITKVDGLAAESYLSLLFPGRDDHLWTYEGQDGSDPSVGTLGANFDYALATLQVASIDEGNKTITASGDATFANQQSIYRFGFKVGGAGEAIAVKSFMVSASQNLLYRSFSYSGSGWNPTSGPIAVETNSSAPADHLYYVALCNENTSADETYTFTVVGSDNALYEGTKDVLAEKLGHGKFFNGNISISQKSFAPASGAVDGDVVKVL